MLDGADALLEGLDAVGVEAEGAVQHLEQKTTERPDVLRAVT